MVYGNDIYSDTLNILGKRKMDKEVVVLMYNGISLSHEINVIRLVAAR